MNGTPKTLVEKSHACKTREVGIPTRTQTLVTMTGISHTAFKSF